MERSRAQAAADELWKLQLRRENKALLDRFEECKKLFVAADAEVQRGYEAERNHVAMLVEKVEVLAKDYVSRSEWLQYQGLQGSAPGRDACSTTMGLRGGLDDAVPEQDRAAKASHMREPTIPQGLSSAGFHQPRKVSRHVPAAKALKSNFFGHSPTQNASDEIDGRISTNAPSARELEAMICEASPSTGGTRSDEDDDDFDDDLDAVNGMALLYPKTSNPGERAGDGFAFGSVGSALAESPEGQPSKVVVLGANPHIERQGSGHSGSTRPQKRSSEATFLTNGDMQATQPAKTLQLNETDDNHLSKRVRLAAQKGLSGHRPQTDSGVVDKTIEKRRTLKPFTRAAAKLPRLVQGKTPLTSYYRESNNAFCKFEDEGLDRQYEFVNHFLAGIHSKKDRDAAVSELQQAKESTIRNGKPWILCYWRDVLSSLVAARLLRREDVA